MPFFENANRADRMRRLSRAVAVSMVSLAAAIAIQATVTHAQEATEQVEETALVDAPTVVAQFTTGVENREPIDQITFVASHVKKVFFFSDLRGLTGETIQHRWIYDGKTVAEVTFEVRGPRWRVWSTKDLLPDWIGDWTVEIVRVDGAAGEVIAAETFTYSAPDA